MNYRCQEYWNIDENHIFICKDNRVMSAFSDDQQSLLMDTEEDSWWFVYRAGIILERMEKFFDKSKLTFDIGAGNGFTSSYVHERGFRMGVIEPSYIACLNAKRRGIDEVNCGTVSNQTIIDESLEQILLLDVLEHIQDDEAFLNTIYRKLVWGGLILITVPAFMALWSSNDEGAGHFRRYRLEKLCDIMKKQGFSICYYNYYMSFLFVPIIIFRVLIEKMGLRKRRTNMDSNERKNLFESEFRQRRGISKVVLSIFEKAESRALRNRARISFGSSIIVVAQKVKS